MYLSNTDVSYVYIETIPKTCVRDNIPVSDCSKELITGVLAGIKEDSYGGVVTRFLLIHDMVRDVRHSLNTTTYNVISIDKEVQSGKRYFTFYSSSKDDQRSALKHVENVIETLDIQDKCFVGRKEVDISKYTDLPTAIAPKTEVKDKKEEKEEKEPFFKPSPNNQVNLGYDCRNKPAYTPTPEPGALFYRRKSDKPDLKQMRSWVRQVMAKKYEDPDIKEIEVKEPTTTTTVHKSGVRVGYDEEYANGMWGY